MEQFEQLLANKWVVLGIFAFVFITSMTVNFYLERQRKLKRGQDEQEKKDFAKSVDEARFYVILKPFENLATDVTKLDYERIKDLDEELKFGPGYEYQEHQLELVLLDIEECLRQMGVSFDKGYFYYKQVSV